LYYRSGTGVAAQARADMCFMFTRQVVALFCMKWRHGSRIEIITSNRKSDSVNRMAFIREEHSCRI